MSETLVGVVCSAVFGLLGFAVSYLTFLRKREKDREDEGASKGVMASDIGYIKSGVDDLKRENREMRSAYQELSTRVTRVEESAKQAHHRIEELSVRIAQ